MIATPWEDEATTACYHDALAAHAGQARSPPRCCTSASCCCSRPRWASCTSPAAPRPSSRTSAACSPSLGLATLPGLLVTDFYDLALAQALPRAQSVQIADAAADGWAAA